MSTQLLFALAGLALASGPLVASTGAATGDGAAEKAPLLGAAKRYGRVPGAGPLDVRLANEVAGPAAKLAIAADRARTGAARQSALDALKKRIAGLTVEDDDLFGTPRFVRSTEAFLTAARPLDVRGAARSFVAAHAALFELEPVVLDRARTTRLCPTRHNGAMHLTLQQRETDAEGRTLDVFGAVMRASITARGELINIDSLFVPAAGGAGKVPAAVIDGATAIAAAAMSVGIDLCAWPEAEGQAGQGGQADQGGEVAGEEELQRWQPGMDFRPEEALTTRRVLFPLTRSELRPAFAVVIAAPGIGHTYDVVVDAVTAAVLHRTDRLVFDTTQPATYRVFTGDSPAPGSPGTSIPSALQLPMVERELVTVAPQSIRAFSPNGWINDGGTETTGNNVLAATDRDGNNQPDVPRPNGTAARVFDFALDLSAGPETYRSAAVTQLFYLGNVYHDRLYALGFDEPAGNFQTVNFRVGGTGNDAITADAQDGADAGSVNNANFNSGGTDGTSARVQMYLWNGPTPDRDGDFDGDIVFHEYSHGLSIRLHGGLAGSQPGGQGEGWSDFFALTLNAQSGDNPHAVYPMAPYATLQLFSSAYTSNYYFGIRRFPYCTDQTKNPLTFADIDTAQFAVPAGVARNTGITSAPSAVHNTGEVWCSTLMDVRAALWDGYGFAGNHLSQQLVVDGMKLAPTNPTFVQSRDAILQADSVNNGGANLSRLWSAFAGRGLGSTAIAPPSTTNSGVVESFVVPQLATFVYPAGKPATVRPGVATPISVRIMPLNLTIDPAGVTLVTTVGTTTVETAMSTSDGTLFEAAIPATGCGEAVEYFIAAQTSVGVRNNPSLGASGANVAAVVSETVVFAGDSFEAATSLWTRSGGTAVSGLWELGDPNGTTAQPESDHTEDGTRCWFTGQAVAGAGVGTNDVDGGDTILLSPVFDLAAQTDARISYWRWYSNGGGGSPYIDTFKVEVSTDGGATWTRAETVGPGGPSDVNTNPGWVRAEWTLASLGLAPTAQVRVRFIAGDADPGSLVEAAVDDFEIVSLRCVDPAPACAPDFNGDGTLDPDDLADYIGAFFSQPPAAGSDFNHDGLTDPDDLADYIGAYYSGC